MKLFFSPGACSLSPHIALREAGLTFDLEQVNLGTKKTKSGGDYLATNPKGAVPALQLDNGVVLTEGAAIVQYIADQKPDAKLAPPAGTFERYQLQEWLNYIATEVHKGYSGFFNPKATEETKQGLREALAKRLDYLDKSLTGKTFLMGNAFTVADGYLFTVISWSKGVGIDLARWPNVVAHSERVKGRPAVKASLEAEQAARG